MNYRRLGLLICSVLVLVLLESLQVDSSSCTATSQCTDSKCCLSPVVRRGKRQTLDGDCMSRPGLGNKCYVNNNVEQVVYYDACPCRPGYTCQGSGVFEVPQGETGSCVATERHCNTSGDCLTDECCVSFNRPIGKRKRSIELGMCQRLGQQGDYCLVKATPVQDLNYACPCASGYSCKGSGVYEIPLGESGTCAHL